MTIRTVLLSLNIVHSKRLGYTVQSAASVDGVRSRNAAFSIVERVVGLEVVVEAGGVKADSEGRGGVGLLGGDWVKLSLSEL